MIERHRHIYLAILVIILACIFSCSPSEYIDDDEKLYTGMKTTKYLNHLNNEHFNETKTEVEVALATSPNGSCFNSPYLRWPFPYAGLWISHTFGNKKGALARWINKLLGADPVYISSANPELHVSVAENILHNYGYFNGKINYDIIDGKKGKRKNDSISRVLTQKVLYKVDMGPVYTIDSLEYVGFTPKELSIIHSSEPLIKKDDAFSVSVLDSERARVYNLLRDSGYYFFEENYLTYMADTVMVPKHVQLRLCKLDSIPEDANKQWKIGSSTFRIRRQMMEQPTDTMTRRSLKVIYAGKKPAIRPGTVLSDVRLRPRQFFSQSDLTESLSRLSAKGIFSSSEISFTEVHPSASDSTTRDSIGKLNMLIDCTLDKPYDFALSANYTHRTSGRSGPGVSASLSKRNPFHRGGVISLTLKGSLDYQLSNQQGDKTPSYDLGATVSLEFPRLLGPKILFPRRRWYEPPSTSVNLSVETVNHSSYFRRNIFSADIKYTMQPNKYSTHVVTPLSISYNRLASYNEEYIDKMGDSGYGIIAFDEYLTPKMEYTYRYSTKAVHRNPIILTATIAESGNVACALMCLGGKGWNEKDKMIVHAPVTQYLKGELDVVKYWTLGQYTKLVGHLFAGYIYDFGNTSELPFTEYYYIGGANDLRGFSSRSLGPAYFHTEDKMLNYLFGNGKLKLVGNLEYRPRIFRSLYGAAFIDVGNVWSGTYLKELYDFDDLDIKAKNLWKDIAVDAGFGLRYDLGFFVLRFDWGFIVHAPYDTGKSGYFNIPSFNKGQCLNFAIGYPF